MHTNLPMRLSVVKLWFDDRHKLFGFYLECICRYIALVDCICMEDVWHANLACRGHPHVPGNISSFNLLLQLTFMKHTINTPKHKLWYGTGGHPHVPGNISSFNLLLLLTFMKHTISTPKHKLWYGIIIGGTNLSEIKCQLILYKRGPLIKTCIQRLQIKAPRFQCIVCTAEVRICILLLVCSWC